MMSQEHEDSTPEAKANENLRIYSQYIQSEGFINFYSRLHNVTNSTATSSIQALIRAKQEKINQAGGNHLKQLANEMSQLAELATEMQTLIEKVTSTNNQIESDEKNVAAEIVTLAPFITAVSNAGAKLAADYFTTPNLDKDALNEIAILSETLKASKQLLSDPNHSQNLINFANCNFKLTKVTKNKEDWRMFKSRVAMAATIGCVVLSLVLPGLVFFIPKFYRNAKQLRNPNQKETKAEELNDLLKKLVAETAEKVEKVTKTEEPILTLTKLKKEVDELSTELDQIDQRIKQEQMPLETTYKLRKPETDLYIMQKLPTDEEEKKKYLDSYLLVANKLYFVDTKLFNPTIQGKKHIIRQIKVEEIEIKNQIKFDAILGPLKNNNPEKDGKTKIHLSKKLFNDLIKSNTKTSSSPQSLVGVSLFKKDNIDDQLTTTEQKELYPVIKALFDKAQILSTTLIEKDERELIKKQVDAIHLSSIVEATTTIIKDPNNCNDAVRTLQFEINNLQTVDKKMWGPIKKEVEKLLNTSICKEMQRFIT